MSDFVLLSTPVAVALLAVLIVFGIGFCLLVLLFQNERERNRILKKRNSQLRQSLREASHLVDILPKEDMQRETPTETPSPQSEVCRRERLYG